MPAQAEKPLLTETASAIPALVSQIQSVAIGIRQGRDAEAFSILGKAVDGLQSYLQVLTLLANQPVPFAAEAEQRALRLAQVLQQAMTVWQREDLVLMADLLLYELAPETAKGQDWLSNLVNS